MDKEAWLGIVNFVIVVGALTAIVAWLSSIRKIRMKKLAEEFGLFFEYRKSFLSGSRSYNILSVLSGNVKGHQIEIRDIQDPVWIFFFGWFVRRGTVFIKDGQAQNGIRFFRWYASIGKIRKWLEAVN